MLKRKMMRDIKNHFGQFFSIFLLSFLAVCLYTGVAGEVVGVEEARENYQERTNLADGWIYGQDFTEAQMEKVPYMLVVGANEAEAGQVAVRRRDKGDMGAVAADEFIQTVKKDIADKTAF